MRPTVAALALLAMSLVPAGAAASVCHAFVGAPGTQVADLGPVAAAAKEVSIAYVGHSTYRIDSPGGIGIETDYFGAESAADRPDVVTMNRAHETHYTEYPDPAIPHVLRGWKAAGDGPAEHDLEVGDVVIRNVTTDIRGWDRPQKDGNSIFIFEIAGLCIGHLGHLHHALGEEHYATIGRLDIVMAPVDGTYTLEVSKMVELMKRLKARIVLPMHAFGPTSLKRFLDGLSDEFAVRPMEGSGFTISLDSLPEEPTVLVPRDLAFGLFR